MIIPVPAGRARTTLENVASLEAEVSSAKDAGSFINYEETSDIVQTSNSYSEDVDNDKIVDSLERDIEENSSREMRILIHYHHMEVFQAESSSSSRDDGFTYELSREFPWVNVEFRFTLIDAVVATAPAKIISEIAKLPNVERIEPDVQVQATLDTAVPVIGADKVWADYSYYGQNQTIAILDTGIWSEHPDFQGKIIGWRDFVNMESDPYDDNGHGTMVASIAAGTGDGSNGTYKGVAYLANIVAVKVLDGRGRGYVSWIILGLEWIVANKDVYNITVVNLSLGSPGPSDGKDVLSLTCDQVVDEGIVVVAAAGNFGPKPYTVGPPAAAEKVIAVGAVDRSMNIASWSSRGPTLDDRFKPDICAVGVSVTAASLQYLEYPELEWKIYRSGSGTSVAAPMIAGAVALLRQAHPDWTPDMVKAALLTRAVQREGGVNNDYGYGVADIFEALKGPAPTLTIYTWKFLSGEPTFAEARAYGQRSPNPYVLINGTWFTPSSLVDIRWDNTTVLVADVPVNENETFALNVTLPRSSWGIHYISAWNTTGFITQNRYEILRPTLDFSASELFQTTIDFARPGVTIWAKGRYCDPNGTVTIKWDNTTILSDNVPTDSEGIFKTDITVPLDATTGLHYVSIWNGTEFATQREFHVVEATPVSGIISGNTTWTRYGSPYLVTGDVFIDENVTLTIESGVKIAVTGYYGILLGSRAILNASGTEESPIILTTNGGSYPGAWKGIWINIGTYNSTIHLNYTIIEFAKNAIGFTSIDGKVDDAIIIVQNCKLLYNIRGIGFEDPYPQVLGLRLSVGNSIVEGCTKEGIRIDQLYPGRPHIINILNNLIRSNTLGIYIGWHHVEDATVMLRNNIIIYNEFGVRLSDNLYRSSLYLLNNYIARNNVGIIVKIRESPFIPDVVIISGNDMHSNVNYNLRTETSYGVTKHNATYNYWGTTSAETIAETIYDFYDDFSLAEVTYIPYLNSSTRARVFGWLMDYATGLPIENATITAIGPSFIYTYSNASGYFALEGLLPGEYSITISKEGYETLSWFECVGEAQAFETEIHMKSNTIYVDDSFVSDSRCDVGSEQTVGFHAIYGIDGSNVTEGTIYVNGTAYSVNGSGWATFTYSSSNLGSATFVVTGVSIGEYSTFVQFAPNVTIIWDRLKIIEGGASETSVTVGENVTIWFRAEYEYDSTPFNSSYGALYVNSSECSWSDAQNRWEVNITQTSIGLKRYGVSEMVDYAHGLIVINDQVGVLSVSAHATMVFNVVWGDVAWPVTVTTNSTITDFNFSQSYIQMSFNVTGQTGTTGFCNVTIPNELLGGPYTVLMDDLPVTPDPIWTWNDTHSSLYFTYNHSTHVVKIIGSTVIPEFPSFIILPLFVIATLLAVIVYKRKKSM